MKMLKVIVTSKEYDDTGYAELPCDTCSHKLACSVIGQKNCYKISPQIFYKVWDKQKEKLMKVYYKDITFLP